LKLLGLIIHVEVKTAPQVLKVRLLPLFERILEKLEVVEKLQVQVV